MGCRYFQVSKLVMSSAKKIRVVELGDVSIVRPEPESVPEDWELAYIKYDAETRNNPSEKWLQLVPQTQATDYCRGFIKREDFFSLVSLIRYICCNREISNVPVKNIIICRI